MEGGAPILFEDEFVTVVDKPAGMVVHPTYRNGSETLLDGLRAGASNEPDSQRPSIVGRLDRLTSGIVVAARSARAHAAFQRALAGAECEKVYVAIVEGDVNPPGGEIDLPLKVDPEDRRRVIVATDGAPSRTGWERVERRGALTRLHCRPVSGRRHQVRVHLAASGWPIAGDAIYGSARAGFPRHALHAWTVAVTHPFTGRRHRWEAPIPEDLLRLFQSGA